MSRRARHDLAPSLFPFLAVLVCTLGTLILLLALVAQQAAETAQQRARQEIADRIEARQASANGVTEAQAVAMIDEAEFHIDTIEKIRDEQAAELESRRDELTHLEDHIERLKQDIDRLNTEMVSAISNESVERIDPATIAMLKDQLSEEELAVKTLQEQKGNETPRVVIVPHKGPNGTSRRPIYVECTSEGLTIWPEGVKISNEQLTGRRSRSANPLDAALRVARLHIMQTYGDADPPYPLLVVRPHGTDAYFQATAAMDDWDDQYGYEMLDRDIELAFHAPDPNLKRKMEKAIRSALARQIERRTPRAVTLSASQLSRDGNSRGFGKRPEHGYGSSRSPRYRDNVTQQTNRLNEIYEDAATELRSRDDPGSPSTTGFGTDRNHSIGTPGQPSDEDLLGNMASSSDRQQSQGTTGSDGPSNSQANGSQASSTRNPEFQPNSGGQPGGTSSDECESCEPTEPSTDQRPRIAASSDRSSNAQVETTVRREGEDWALPKHVANARGISIIRAIRVEFHSDRFVVPASRTDKAKVIPFNGNLDLASLKLATVLRDRIDRWGVALDNGRWEPRLEVDLIDGDQRRLEQLTQLLEGSGIEVSQRHSK